MLVTFMEVLDTSIAVVSLPHISGNLSAGIDESTWVLTSYLVSNAIVLPLSGWFSSLFGRKRFFMACVGVFMASSLLCGLAPTLPWLVVFRILQGAGGGSMQPIAQAILAESFPPHRRGMAMAVYAMGVVVAPIVGPTVGGWITDNYSWRWIFFINVPVGMISLLMASWVIQDPPYLVRRTFRTGLRIDYIGLALLSVGLGALQIVLDKGQREDWMESNFILILTVITAASLVALVFWELRQSQPVVELHLLKGRNFAVSTFTMFALGFVLYGSTALLPIFLQTMLGYTAMLSGLVLSPGGLATMIALPLVGRLLGRFEPRWLVVIGVVAVVASLVQMSHFNLQVDFATAAWARVLQGVGLAFLFVPVNTMAFQPLARHQMNYASGLINLARNIGGSCGIAFVTTVLARAAQVHQNHLVGNLSPLNVGYRNALDGATAALTAAGSGPVEAAQQAQGLLYGGLIRESTMLAFVDNFRMLAILFAFIVPLMFLMKKISPSKGPTLAH
ncbi:MAG: DHA2 family efflux MFS transporter permease subunit [Planctomycetota bacterium]|nr:DHA2 family efflux MFS transporter permease subunit [Planctomycetota bacterium]